MGAGVLSPGLKLPQHEAGRSSPCSAEVKNEWRCTTCPPYAFVVCTGTALPLLKLLSFLKRKNMIVGSIATVNTICYL